MSLIVTIGLGLLLGATPRAEASICDTSWTGNAGDGDWFTAGNWDNGVPTSSSAACITLDGTYTVTITAQQPTVGYLTLGGSSGTQTLAVNGYHNVGDGALTLASGGTSNTHGVLRLDCLPDAATCNGQGNEFLNVTSGTFDNGGTIALEGNSQQPLLLGNITNTGVIQVDALTSFAKGGATLTNQGSITIANNTSLHVSPGWGSGAPTFVNDTGGSITTTGTGELDMDGPVTFVQGAGTTSGNPVRFPYNPTHGTLTFTSSGQSSFLINGQVTLNGNVAATQTITVANVPNVVTGDAQLTSSGSFTNAGHLSLTCDPSVSCNGVGSPRLNITSGAMTNTGTVTLEGGTAGPVIHGSVTNASSGSVQVNSASSLVTGVFDDFGTLSVATLATLVNVDQTLVVEPGGTFTLTGCDLPCTPGSYVQGAGASLGVTVDAIHTTYTGITGGGNTALDGKLQVTTLGAPALDSLWPVIVGTSRSGTFSLKDYGSVAYATLYPSTGVTLQAPAPPAQTISISNLPTSGTVGGSFTATFAYTGVDTPWVESNTPLTCNVTAGQVVHFLAPGTCTLVARAPDATGPEQSFTITPAAGPPVSQITPTNTTCAQFASGSAADLLQVQYSTKGGKVSQVNPGALFYWVRVDAAPGTNTYTIRQTTSATSRPFVLQPGGNVYTSACTTVKGAAVRQSSSGDVTVSFNAGTGGTFYLGIKLSPSKTVGETAPNPSTVTYTFTTTGVSGSTSVVDFAKKTL